MMTEDQIERRVERDMNTLDKCYMAGDISEDAYQAEVKAIDDWAKEQYKILERNRSSI